MKRKESARRRSMWNELAQAWGSIKAMCDSWRKTEHIEKKYGTMTALEIEWFYNTQKENKDDAEGY